MVSHLSGIAFLIDPSLLFPLGYHLSQEDEYYLRRWAKDHESRSHDFADGSVLGLRNGKSLSVSVWCFGLDTAPVLF